MSLLLALSFDSRKKHGTPLPAIHLASSASSPTQLSTFHKGATREHQHLQALVEMEVKYRTTVVFCRLEVESMWQVIPATIVPSILYSYATRQ